MYRFGARTVEKHIVRWALEYVPPSGDATFTFGGKHNSLFSSVASQKLHRLLHQIIDVVHSKVRDNVLASPQRVHRNSSGPFR